MKLSNKTYDILKKISLIAGYIATFVLTLSDIWGFQYGTSIAATVSALGVLLGVVLQESTKKYYNESDEDAAELDVDDPDVE